MNYKMTGDQLPPSVEIQNYINKELNNYLYGLLDLYPVEPRYHVFCSLPSNVEEERAKFQENGVPIDNRKYSITFLNMN